jgi:hypothetical protein
MLLYLQQNRKENFRSTPLGLLEDIYKHIHPSQAVLQRLVAVITYVPLDYESSAAGKS